MYFPDSTPVRYKNRDFGNSIDYNYISGQFPSPGPYILFIIIYMYLNSLPILYSWSNCAIYSGPSRKGHSLERTPLLKDTGNLGSKYCECV